MRTYIKGYTVPYTTPYISLYVLQLFDTGWHDVCSRQIDCAPPTASPPSATKARYSRGCTDDAQSVSMRRRTLQGGASVCSQGAARVRAEKGGRRLKGALSGARYHSLPVRCALRKVRRVSQGGVPQAGGEGEDQQCRRQCHAEKGRLRGRARPLPLHRGAELCVHRRGWGYGACPPPLPSRSPVCEIRRVYRACSLQAEGCLPYHTHPTLPCPPSRPLI